MTNVLLVGATLAACVGCGEQPDYTVNGIDIYGAKELGVKKVDIAFVLKRTREVLAQQIGSPYTMRKTQKAIDTSPWTLKVHFLESDMCPSKDGTTTVPCGFKCGSASPSGRCNGLHAEGEMLVAVPPGQCVFKSSLSHEFIHMFQWIVEKKTNINHDVGLFFVNVCNQPDVTDDWYFECRDKTVEYPLDTDLNRRECS